MDKTQKGQGIAQFLFVIFIIFLIVFGIFRGAFVSKEKAQMAATSLIDTNAVIEDKIILFVGLRGCDEGDAALFTIKPFTNDQDVFVDDAILCSGWPFKGFTPRYK